VAVHQFEPISHGLLTEDVCALADQLAEFRAHKAGFAG